MGLGMGTRDLCSGRGTRFLILQTVWEGMGLGGKGKVGSV